MNRAAVLFKMSFAAEPAVRQHRCTQCTKSFTFRTNLTRHVKRVHSASPSVHSASPSVDNFRVSHSSSIEASRSSGLFSSSSDQFFCQFCGEQVITAAALSKHEALLHRTGATGTIASSPTSGVPNPISEYCSRFRTYLERTSTSHKTVNTLVSDANFLLTFAVHSGIVSSAPETLEHTDTHFLSSTTELTYTNTLTRQCQQKQGHPCTKLQPER